MMNTRPTTSDTVMQNSQQSVTPNLVAGVAIKPGGSSTNISSSHQTGIGLKPNSQTPPAHVLQVVKQVQEEAARQQAPHVSYGKVNPSAAISGQISGVMPPPQIQRNLPVQMTNQSGSHLMSMDQWTPR